MDIGSSSITWLFGRPPRFAAEEPGRLGSGPASARAGAIDGPEGPSPAEGPRGPGPGAGAESPKAVEPVSPAPRGADQLVLDPAATTTPAGDTDAAGGETPGAASRPAGRPGSETAPAASAESGRASGGSLTEEEQQRVEELRSRDAEVRTHEQAHKAAGGRHAGAISYSYTTGPDGQRYATGGSVPIDVSPIAGDPDATVAKMQVVISAALAPARPSSADHSVAAKARRTMAEARGSSAAATAETRTDDSDAPDRATGIDGSTNVGPRPDGRSVGQADAPRLGSVSVYERSGSAERIGPPRDHGIGITLDALA